MLATTPLPISPSRGPSAVAMSAQPPSVPSSSQQSPSPSSSAASSSSAPSSPLPSASPSSSRPPLPSGPPANLLPSALWPSTIPFRSLPAQETSWDPSSIRVSMNLAIDETCDIVQSDGSVVKRTVANVVVVDNLFDEPNRAELFEFITALHSSRPLTVDQDKGTQSTSSHAPPSTTRLRDDVIHRLLHDANLTAVREISSRLQRLYPEYAIGLVPGQRFFAHNHPGNPRSQPTECDASAMTSTAATYGDDFQWHADADPMSFHPLCAWSRHFGNYCNHAPGKPLFVSLLLFLDRVWPLHMNAETFILDPDTDSGVFIRPRAYRAVLMDQDVQHRFSTPAPAAGPTAQRSLAWKLVFVPRTADTVVTLARPEWGRPCLFGSASNVPPADDALEGEVEADTSHDFESSSEFESDTDSTSDVDSVNDDDDADVDVSDASRNIATAGEHSSFNVGDAGDHECSTSTVLPSSSSSLSDAAAQLSSSSVPSSSSSNAAGDDPTKPVAPSSSPSSSLSASLLSTTSLSSKRKHPPSWSRNYYDESGQRRSKTYSKSKYPDQASVDAAFHEFLKVNSFSASRRKPSTTADICPG